jgi:hypothetical protein
MGIGPLFVWVGEELLAGGLRECDERARGRMAGAEGWGGEREASGVISMIQQEMRRTGAPAGGATSRRKPCDRNPDVARKSRGRQHATTGSTDSYINFVLDPIRQMRRFLTLQAFQAGRSRSAGVEARTLMSHAIALARPRGDREGRISGRQRGDVLNGQQLSVPSGMGHLSSSCLHVSPEGTLWDIGGAEVRRRGSWSGR